MGKETFRSPMKTEEPNGQLRLNGRVFDIQYLEDGYATLIEYNMEKLNKLSCSSQQRHIASQAAKLNNKVKQAKGKEHHGTTSGGSSPLARVFCLFTTCRRYWHEFDRPSKNC